MRFWALPIALAIASMSKTLADDTAVIVNICLNGLCGNKFGNCSSRSNICSVDCQIQCTPTPDGDLSSLISRDTFNEMLKHRNDANCPAKGFYTYNSFIAAAKSFAGFGTTGDFDTRKREIAAFLGQTSIETSGGWASAPDGSYAWGYCYKESQKGYQDTYCVLSSAWPCASGVKYYGRGPFQIIYNYNYGAAGRGIGVDLLTHPYLVATDPVISFKTALWFWMTPQSPRPSCHNVITGQWKPSSKDMEAGRDSGYGVITNLINGGIECNRGSNQRVIDRIGFYKRYCDILKVPYGNNLDCYNQTAFG